MGWRRAAWLGLAALVSCGGTTTRVLFIGNSLTAVNDVPGQVAALSRAAGTQMTVDAVVLPGASLEDHLLEGTARRRIESQRWDFVVLSQGPSSRPESRVLLRRDAARFAELARAAGARPALYMVWPIQAEPERWPGPCRRQGRERSEAFNDVRDSYRLAAQDVGGLFLPAGLAWRAAWEIDPTLQLYSADGLHPTFAGSYAAALVIHAVLSGRSPLGAPALGGLDAQTVQTLQAAAEEVTRAGRLERPDR